MQSSPPSSSPGTMSERQSYESRMADLKLKRFASHRQSTHEQDAVHDDGEPRRADIHSISPGKPEKKDLLAKNVFNGLKVGQAGMIWGPDGILLGKVQDDSLADPEELEGCPLNERGEVIDENGQKIGQARVHEVFVGTKPTSAREHSFYKMKPDENGCYHCPYTALGVCWYRPQKLKSNFESVISGDVFSH